VRGFEHDPSKKWTVYYLAIFMALAAMFGTVPALMDAVGHFRSLDSRGIAPWAYGLILLGGMQLAYALYLAQLPDWSTVWVVSLVALFMATAYAMLLGLILLAREESQLIQLLGLADKLYGNKATGWTLIMLSLSGLLAYFSGRISVRWHHAYRILTQSNAE
jgi:hypothetical protein